MRIQWRSVSVTKILQVSIPLLGLWLFLGANVPTVQAFHFPWDQSHDTTDWQDPNDPGPCEGGICQCDTENCDSGMSPVYMATGHFVWTDTDILLKGRPGIKISRTYNSNDPRDGLFGSGWSFTHDRTLLKVSQTNSQGVTQYSYIMRLANGKRYQFEVASDGTITPPPGVFQRIEPQQDGSTHLINLDGSYEVYAMDSLQQAVDRNGNVLNYQYDEDWVLSGISDTNGRGLEFIRNSAGRIVSIIDHTSRTWNYDYDENGSLTSVRDPLGGETRYQYQEYTPLGDNHTYYQLTRITDPTDIIVTQITYNKERVHTYTTAENSFTLAYDTVNRIATKTDSIGSTWRSKYNQDGLFIERTDPLNHTVFHERDNNGLNTKITDELGNSFDSIFDELGRLTSRSDTRGVVSLEYQNELPWVTKIKSRTGRIHQLTYDSSGNTLSMSDPLNEVTKFEWNNSGDLVSIINALDERSIITSNAIGLPTTITDALNRVITFIYDNRGNVISITNPEGETIQYEYDVLDRLVRGINTLNHRTEYSYDAASRLKDIIAPNNERVSYIYDSFGRLIQRINYDASINTYVYGRDNLPVQFIQPSGTITTFSYNSAKQLIKVNIGGESTTYQYTARGKLSQASNQMGTVNMTYDNIGRLLSEKVNGQTIQYVYNNEDELTQLIGLGKTQLYQYDQRGLLTQISGATGQYVFNYDSLGRRSQLTQPNANEATYQYDTVGQLTQIQHAGVFNAILQYQFDDAGRIIGLFDDSTPKSYKYDQAGRLIQADDDRSTSYQYDVLGNNLNNNSIYDTANRLTQDINTQYHYDQNGNLVQKQNKLTGALTAYTWDAKNQLVKVEQYTDGTLTTLFSTITYTYGPFGRRWSKTVNGDTEKYVYSGSDRVGKLDQANNVVEYVTFSGMIDEPIGMEKNGNNLYFHANHQNSTLALSDGQSDVVSYHYSAYGKTTVTGDSDINDFLYTGREYDGNDLYYYRARYFDSNNGRFISSDPIGLAGGLNTYNYVENSPVNLVDPFGLVVKLCSRELGNKNGPPMSRWNPLRHDYLVVNDEIYSFQSGGNMFWSQGWIDNEENPSTKHCKVLWEDNSHDQYVKDAVDSIGTPKYNVWAYPGTTTHLLGAKNCQSWASDVIREAIDEFDKDNNPRKWWQFWR